MGYIIFVAYDNDAERKRIDYLLGKWSSRATVKKPKGIVFYIETNDVQEFLEDLFSRVEGNVEEKIRVYSAKRIEKRIRAKRRILKYVVPEEKKVVERFIEYLLSKMNASYFRSENEGKVYSIYTRKGRAGISVIIEGNGRTEVTFEIESYGDAVDLLAERIDEEFKLFVGGGDGNI